MEVALFDVRVFNPFTASAVSVPLPQLYQPNENEKRRKYEQGLLAENCSFTLFNLFYRRQCQPTHQTFSASALGKTERKSLVLMLKHFAGFAQDWLLLLRRQEVCLCVDVG